MCRENLHVPVYMYFLYKLTWRVVPSMSMWILRFCENAGSHFVFARGRFLLVRTKGDVGASTWWTENPEHTDTKMFGQRSVVSQLHSLSVVSLGETVKVVESYNRTLP